MPDLDPGRAATLDELALCLARLRLLAGQPTIRALEEQTGKSAGSQLPGTTLKSVRLGRTSLHGMLAGRSLPSKEFLLTFVHACGVDLVTDHRWDEAWNRLAPRYRYRVRQPAGRATQAYSAPDSDAELHRQIADLRTRAEHADASSEQLRRQVAELQARADASSEQLRRQIAEIEARAGAASGQMRAIAPSFQMPAEYAADASPELEPLRRWDPEQVGQFEILGRLGAGAMGQVYLGRSQAGRLVAVKTIKIELAEEPGFREHFAHEVAAARRVSGMFTASVVAADPEADMPWLATAYVPAPSLSRLVGSGGPQPVPTIWWLAAGCAEALESIHGAGLVHRDLKPSNVLVAPSGPLVIDFGVARAIERITVAPDAVGTPGYMAPEQARDPRQASAASDIFALGATLLYAATGHAPFRGETAMDVLVRLATEPPDLSGLPAELTELIAGCLERSPRDRPTSAALLAQVGPLMGTTRQTAGATMAGSHPFLAEAAMTLIAESGHGPAAGAHRALDAGVRGVSESRAGLQVAGADVIVSDVSGLLDACGTLGSEAVPNGGDPSGEADAQQVARRAVGRRWPLSLNRKRTDREHH